MKPSIIITTDGSHTLTVPRTMEHYHSVHGAIAESQHIYINAGLIHAIKDNKHLNILEIGFGTGLNALLTYIELSKLNITCEYTAVEAYPLDEDIFTQLNYSELLNVEPSILLKLHRSEWNAKTEISKGFIIHKICEDAGRVTYPANTFNLVYFVHSPLQCNQRCGQKKYSLLFIYQ